MKVLFLTEYSKYIGHGHLSRSMSIGDQFVKNGFEVQFLIRAWTDEALSMPYPHEKAEWKDPAVLGEHLQVDAICIIDTYQVSKAELNRLCGEIDYPISISDSRLNFPDKGMVILGSVYGKSLEQELPAAVDSLAGPEYLLFRKDYWNVPKVEIRPAINKVLISVGGFSQGELMQRLLSCLRKMLPEVQIVIAGQAEQAAPLENVSYLGFLSTADYIRQLSDVDLMISNGGQSLNEAVLLGIPTLAICVAENQRRNIQAWTALGMVLSALAIQPASVEDELIHCLEILEDAGRRSALAEAGKQLIDSQGSRRVFEALLKKLNINDTH